MATRAKGLSRIATLPDPSLPSSNINTQREGEKEGPGRVCILIFALFVTILIIKEGSGTRLPLLSSGSRRRRSSISGAEGEGEREGGRKRESVYKLNPRYASHSQIIISTCTEITGSTSPTSKTDFLNSSEGQD